MNCYPSTGGLSDKGGNVSRWFVMPLGGLAGLAVSVGLSATSGASGFYKPSVQGCNVWDAEPAAVETVSWTGACVNGLAEGTGVLDWTVAGKPDVHYEGAMKQGKMSGKGRLVWPTGSTYTGDFADDKPSGRGVRTWAVGPYAGDSYDGDFLDGERTGVGQYRWANGNRYTGQFTNGQINGLGEMLYADGRRYAGMFVNGNLVQSTAVPWSAQNWTGSADGGAEAAAPDTGPTYGFEAPPPDTPEDCSPSTAFNAWIARVTDAATRGNRGICWAARGTEVVNRAGAHKARYCAGLAVGAQRQQALSQADEFDRVAARARQTEQGVCSP